MYATRASLLAVGIIVDALSLEISVGSTDGEGVLRGKFWIPSVGGGIKEVGVKREELVDEGEIMRVGETGQEKEAGINREIKQSVTFTML